MKIFFEIFFVPKRQKILNKEKKIWSEIRKLECPPAECPIPMDDGASQAATPDASAATRALEIRARSLGASMAMDGESSATLRAADHWVARQPGPGGRCLRGNGPHLTCKCAAQRCAAVGIRLPAPRTCAGTHHASVASVPFRS